MSTTTTTVEELKYEYYFQDGHFNNVREVLTGDKAVKTFEEIPQIDISGIFSNNVEDRMKVAREVDYVCQNVGFFYIKNHGVDQAMIDGMYETSQKYFAQPEAKKMEEFVFKSPTLRGYDGLYQEKRGNVKKGELKEGFLYSYDPEADPVPPQLTEEQRSLLFTNQWPAEWPEFRTQLLAYQTRMLTLARKMMQMFALALGTEETYFDQIVTAPFASIKMIHYPPQSASGEEETGSPSHTDFETFTILGQDMVGGLQVLNKNAHWVNATPIPGTFVVNVGDFLQRISNDRWISTVHRVINRTGKERYSMPFFFSFNMDAEVAVVPSCISEENPSKYSPRNLAAYTAKRRAQQKARFDAKQAADKKAAAEKLAAEKVEN